jgi:hypothetical protein
MQVFMPALHLDYYGDLIMPSSDEDIESGQAFNNLEETVQRHEYNLEQLEGRVYYLERLVKQLVHNNASMNEGK